MIKNETGQATMFKRIELRSPGIRYECQKNAARDQLKGRTGASQRWHRDEDGRHLCPS